MRYFVGYVWREHFFIHIMQILDEGQDEEEGAKNTKKWRACF